MIEPQWSEEEQAMLELMKLNGCEVNTRLTKDWCTISIMYPNALIARKFSSDTGYETIRKAFTYWSGRNG